MLLSCDPDSRASRPPLAQPAFNLNDFVEYRWSTNGPFVGAAQVTEVFRDGRYRLQRLDGIPFPKAASIFGEGQLQLHVPLARSA